MAERDLADQLDRAIESLLAGALTAPEGDPELEVLAAIASELCHLPAEDFQVRLQKELQRRAAMTASPSAVAAGFRTIAPFLIHAQAPKLVEFLKSTFGAEELKRNAAGEPSGFYAEVRIGDTVMMIAGGPAARHGNVPSALHAYVEDCDAVYRRALAAGAVTLGGALGEPTDQPYGERSAAVQDAFGNYWYIATRLSPGPETEAAGTVIPYLHPENARQYIDFLQGAFGAEVIMVVEHAGRVMHASVRVGNAVLEMGEPAGGRSAIPANGCFLFVDDVEAAYAKALAAGAAAVRPPQNVPTGLRSAIVQDPAGYLWWPAQWIR